MFFQNLAFILPSFQQFLLKRMLIFSHNLGCVTVRDYAGTCKGICSYNLVYNFLIQLLSLKSLVSVVHFLNAFWHGNKAFPKGSSQNEIVPPPVVFHLPYCKYKGVKMLLLMSLSKSKIFTLVSLVSFVQHSCRTCVALVSLMSGIRVVNQTTSASEIH